MNRNINHQTVSFQWWCQILIGCKMNSDAPWSKSTPMFQAHSHNPNNHAAQLIRGWKFCVLLWWNSDWKEGEGHGGPKNATGGMERWPDTLFSDRLQFLREEEEEGHFFLPQDWKRLFSTIRLATVSWQQYLLLLPFLLNS